MLGNSFAWEGLMTPRKRTGTVVSSWARLRRSTAMASSMPARSSSANSERSFSQRPMRFRTEANSSWEGMAALRAHSSSSGAAAESFVISEQTAEIGTQFGEEKRVGAVVGAPEALMTERACLASGFHVGGFQADPERDRHLSHALAQVLAFQQTLHCWSGSFGAAVELQPGKLVDRLALSLVRDPVVALGGGQFSVPHEVGEHVNGDALVGEALGEGVPE